MAQETNILVQVSDDGAVWSDLVTLTAGTVSHKHTGLTLATTKYYRTIAKGDGVNTLDSLPSQAVSVATGFSTEYQAVLDYASANSIGVPSFTQNVLNDIVVRNLVKADKWKELDFLYYFQQEAGTPYEFLTLNWKDATKHRLQNIGTNQVTFTGSSGFNIAGSNSQYFNTQFTPSTQAVKSKPTDYGLIFKTFNVPATYANNLRVIGGSGGGTVNVVKTSDTLYLSRVYNNVDSRTVTMAEFSGHTQWSLLTNKNERLFKDGEYLSLHDGTAINLRTYANVPLHIFGYNNAGTPNPSEGGFGLSYIGLGSNLLYSDNLVYKILNHTYSFEETTPLGVSRYTAAVSALPSLYMPQVIRADKFPSGTLLEVTKKYIVLYSTDHGTTNGATAWGETNYPNLSDFVEKGVIVSQYESETPHLEYVPNDPDGHVLHFYFHTYQQDPNNENTQQTRLWTAPAGTLLHDQTAWTDRDNPLGITQFETDSGQPHTGYLVVMPQQDGTFKGVHSVVGWRVASGQGDTTTADTVPKIGISSASATGRDWTRTIQTIDVTSFMPYYRQFHHTRFLFFTRGVNQYLVGCNTKYNFDFTDTKIAIAKTDGNYNPVELMGNISGKNSGDGCGNAAFYIDEVNAPDTLNIYYIMNKTDLFHTTWDLKNLD